MSKVTIRDIAKEAGVSIATVSNVINGIKKCRLETKTKVLDAIKKLDYKQNISAKTLATKRSGLIGVIVPKDSRKNHINHTNIFIAGINHEIKNYDNYDLLITEVFDTGDELTTWVSRRDLEGIIFMGNYNEEILRSIGKLDIPKVMIDNYNQELVGVSYIHSEETMGGYLAVEHLVNKGAKSIAFISRELRSYEVDNRKLYGYITAIEEFGLYGSEENILETDGTFKASYDRCKELLEEKKVDGLIFSSGDLALGGMKYVNEMGINIPMITFGELEIWDYLTPRISSIDEHSRDKGNLAVRTLLESIEKGKVVRGKNISVSIIERR